jgi:hypothetical protein
MDGNVAVVCLFPMDREVIIVGARGAVLWSVGCLGYTGWFGLSGSRVFPRLIEMSFRCCDQSRGMAA